MHFLTQKMPKSDKILPKKPFFELKIKKSPDFGAFLWTSYFEFHKNVIILYNISKQFPLGKGLEIVSRAQSVLEFQSVPSGKLAYCRVYARYMENGFFLKY